MLRSLREIRSFRVAVFHPADHESDELVAQIRRIGCKVELIWPPRDQIPAGTDIAFILFRQDALTAAILNSLHERPASLALIAIVEFESPAVVEAVARSGACAVITKPIRGFGLLTTMVIAHSLAERKNVSDRKMAKLQARVSGMRDLEHVKCILMSRKGLTEQAAYARIRERSMAKRMSIEAFCASVVHADDLPEL